MHSYALAETQVLTDEQTLQKPDNRQTDKISPKYTKKLDSVGPVDNGPSTDPPLCLIFCRIKTTKTFFFFFYLTGDRWQVTGDPWQVTCDMWHMTHGVEWIFSQNFSHLAQMVWYLWCCEYVEEKDDSLKLRFIWPCKSESNPFWGIQTGWVKFKFNFID